MRACKKNSVKKKKVFLRFLKCDFATPGKPCVQNDMRVKSKMDEEPSSLNDASTNYTISVPRFFSPILILTAWWNHWNAVFQKRILPPTNPSPWDNTLKIPSTKPLSIGTTRSQQTDSSILAGNKLIVNQNRLEKVLELQQRILAQTKVRILSPRLFIFFNKTYHGHDLTNHSSFYIW